MQHRRVLEIQRVWFGDLTPAWPILELEDIGQQLVHVHQTLHRMRFTKATTP